MKGNGLPDGILGRIGVTVSGADSNRVYAIIEAKEGGIFRSDDAGEKWTKINDDGRFRQRAWYFSKIYADPKSADTVYVLNTGSFNRSMAARLSIFFRRVMAIITGSGLIRKIRIGSATRTTAAPASQSTAAKPGRRKTISRPRSFITSRSTTRFRITFTARNRTTRMSASRAGRDSGVIGREDWFEAGDGECGFVVPDPRDWHIIYSNSEGYAVRYDKNKEASAGHQSVCRSTTPGTARSIWSIVSNGSRRLMLSPHNPDVALHRGGMRFQIDRSRPELDADQRGPDAQRQNRNNNRAAARSRTTSRGSNITTPFSRWPNRR